MPEDTNTLLEDELLRYLPQAMREDSGTEDFLRAFGAILFGTNKPGDDLGLEQVLDDLPRYFTPGTGEEDGCPDDFLPWLGQWLALSLRTDIYWEDSNAPAQNNKVRRGLIAAMAEIYRWRGTKQSMLDLLRLFTRTDATIDDQIDGKPHFFRVWLNLESLKTSSTQAAYDHAMELARSVIDKEKPAHTYYELIPEIITMRIGPGVDEQGNPYFIKVGENSRIGVKPR
jgi:phage tail-like protein